MIADVELLWDVECRLAESPVWDRRSNRIFFVDQDGGRILAYGTENDECESWTLPGRVGSLGLCASGRLIVAMGRKIAFFDTRGSLVQEVVGDIDEPPGNRFNDGKVGPDGCFWVGTRDGRLDAGPVQDGSACLYRVTPAGMMERKKSDYVLSNGLAWSGDGRRMYHADSHSGRIDVWDFDGEGGAISNQHCFATLTVDEGLPDGAGCDVHGCYWSAAPSAGCINRFSADGRLMERIDVPCEAPTMVCFADDWMYMTSMRQKPGMPRSGRKFDGGALFRLRAPVAGVEVSRFADA